MSMKKNVPARSHKKAAPQFRFVSLTRAAGALSQELPPQLAVSVPELTEALREMTPRDGGDMAAEIFRRLDS